MTQIPKIDVHYHPGDWAYLNTRSWEGDLFRILDRFQIVCAVLSHSQAVSGSASQEGNRRIIELCRRDPRLRAYIYLNPYDVEGSLQDLEIYGDDSCVVGVKTRVDFHRVRLDGPHYSPLIEEAARRRLTLLSHRLDEAELQAASRFSSWNIIVTHADVDTVRSSRAHPRVYFDIAASSGDRLSINVETILELAGDDRVVYGSDAPLIHPAWVMSKFDSAELTGAQRRKIYYDNALKAFPRLEL